MEFKAKRVDWKKGAVNCGIWVKVSHLIGTSDTWLFQQNGKAYPFRASGNWRCNSGQAAGEDTRKTGVTLA
jgi:hypothetical protein